MDTFGPGHRILLVSGDYDACDEWTAVLRQQGHRVDFAYDSRSALELARQNAYDAFVLDHWPPYLDAIGLCRRLERDTPAVTVLLLGNELQYEPDVPGDHVHSRAQSGETLAALLCDALAEACPVAA